MTFRETFAEMGGFIGGELRTGETPQNTTTLASTTSPSTGHLVREMIKYSNNQMAEQLAAVSANQTYGRSNQWLQNDCSLTLSKPMASTFKVLSFPTHQDSLETAD